MIAMLGLCAPTTGSTTKATNAHRSTPPRRPSGRGSIIEAISEYEFEYAERRFVYRPEGFKGYAEE